MIKIKVIQGIQGVNFRVGKVERCLCLAPSFFFCLQLRRRLSLSYINGEETVYSSFMNESVVSGNIGY